MKLTIYKKIMLAFCAIITIMVIASVYVLLELNTVSDAAKITLTSNVQSIDLAKQLQTIMYDESGYAQKYLISRDETYFSLFFETSQRVAQYWDPLYNLQPDEPARSLVRNMRQTHESFVASIKSERDQKESGHDPIRDDMRSDSMKALYHSLDRLINLNHLSIGINMSKVETTTGRSIKVSLSLIALTLLTAITVAFIVARTITRPIGDLIRGTEQISRGRFEPISVYSNDEIALLADAFNDMGEKIKKTNELKAQMMQQISHELQTPLQAMLFAHDILKEQTTGPLNDEQLQMLDTISGGINKLASFRKQYLDLAKIESGMMEYNMKPVELLPIVEPLVEDVKLIAARKNITVGLTASAAPRIMADAEKISVVVSNLLGNAIKYAKNGGKVSVSVGPCTMGAQVAVQDSGIGINPEELSKIFSRFYQGKNPDIIKRDGTGVGLALVKAFTEGHGGKIHAESTVDLGSMRLKNFNSLHCPPQLENKIAHEYA
ncbi:MAG: HAMP domain-containing protein [Deltaproteobacteria bacterium]|nr:HAMP domain-containing protein [Deltaproteobacteria bacterium]